MRLNEEWGSGDYSYPVLLRLSLSSSRRSMELIVQLVRGRLFWDLGMDKGFQ